MGIEHEWLRPTNEEERPRMTLPSTGNLIVVDALAGMQFRHSDTVCKTVLP